MVLSKKIVLQDNIKEIPGGAFYGVSSLEEIVLPDGLTEIGQSAFEDCINLKFINFPHSLTVIGYHAFAKCDSLQEVYLHENLDEVDFSAFTACDNLKKMTVAMKDFDGVLQAEHLKQIYFTDNVENISSSFPDSLTHIDVDENNPYYSSEDGVLFDKEKKTLLKYPSSKNDEEYSIPDSVETIREYGFAKNEHIKYIQLPEKLQKIETYAFYNLPSLESISTIPGTVKEIGKWAFWATGLTDVYFDGTVDEWKKISYYEKVDFGQDDEGNEFVVIYTSFFPDVTVHFKGDVIPPENPDVPEEPEHTHSFTSGVVLDATCEEDGIMSFLCKCGQSYTDIIPAKGHKDENGDYKCDNGCGYEYEKPAPEDPSEDCDCNCHKTGFIGFIWKIVQFFSKLFKINPTCECGVAHY